MKTLLGACGCEADGALCDACRAAAVRVATAAAAVTGAVHEIEHEDPQSNRVFTLRRGGDGRWFVVDVRRMGSIERGRVRPQPESA